MYTCNAALWEAEFRTFCGQLFGDPANDEAAQTLRLYNLRHRASLETRLIIPDFVLREVLSAGRRKHKSAPGPDGVSWSALSALPRRATLMLLALFEARLNCDEGHEGTRGLLKPGWTFSFC